MPNNITYIVLGLAVILVITLTSVIGCKDNQITSLTKQLQEERSKSNIIQSQNEANEKLLEEYIEKIEEFKLSQKESKDIYYKDLEELSKVFISESIENSKEENEYKIIENSIKKFLND